MAHESWLPQIVLAIAIAAVLFGAIRAQMLVPIADGPALPGPMPAMAEEDDEEREHPKRAPVRRKPLPLLTAAVVLTAAVRVAFLVALQR